MATITPTAQQQDVLDQIKGYFETKYGPEGYHKIFAIFLSAVAGSGKTSTIMMIAEMIAQLERDYGTHIEWTSLSFNKIIQITTNAKYQERGLREVAKTTNSLGRSILAEAGRSGQCHPIGKLDKYKYDNIIKNYCRANQNLIPYVTGPAKESELGLVSKIKRLVSASRLAYVEPSEENLLSLIEHYPDTNIDPYSPYWPFIWKAIQPVGKLGIEMYQFDGSHDFDDQIFLPLALDVAAPVYDLICIDEAQDLNKVRTQLVERALKSNGCAFFVGDRRQAIQGFAYADTASVDNIIHHMGAIEMPLTCSWRCDLNIIKLAQVINPEIEVRPGAPGGTIGMVGDDYIDMMESGYYHPTNKDLCKDPDFGLCRVNADLVKACLTAIRKGKYAVVRGRSIGDSIVKLLKKVLETRPEAYDLRKLNDALYAYYADQAASLTGRKNAEEEIDKLSDQIDTLDALIDGYWMSTPVTPSLADLLEFITSKFQGDEGDPEEKREGPLPIIFSTVHKAKGLETDRVFILRPDLMPHPMASKYGKAWQIEQEYNCLYVAITRPRKELYFVGGIPAILRDKYEELTAPPALTDADAGAAVAEVGRIIEMAMEQATVVTEETDDLPSNEDQETVQAPASAPTEPKKGKGRKAYDQADRKQPLQFLIDPDMRRALKSYVESLNLSGDISEFTDGAKLTETDVIIAALLALPGFSSHFETSDVYTSYVDRKERQRQIHEASVQQKGGKKQHAPALPQPQEDDDGPGGGQPGPQNDRIIDTLRTLGQQMLEEEEDTVSMRDDSGFSDWLVERMPPASLFPEVAPVQETREVRRVFYTCSSKFCGRSWAVDYYISSDGQMYRTTETGQIVYAALDFQICPYCSNERRFLKRSIMRKASYSSRRKCDPRCWNARPGSPCRCECGGTRHGLGEQGSAKQVEFIGKDLLSLQAKQEDGEGE